VTGRGRKNRARSIRAADTVLAFVLDLKTQTEEEQGVRAPKHAVGAGVGNL